MIGPIARSITPRYSAIVASVSMVRSLELVALGALLSACATAPIVPDADPVAEAAIAESRALGEEIGAAVVSGAQNALPLLGVAEVIGEMNALITAVEDWYDALVRVFPTSHEVNFEEMDALNLARDRGTHLVAQLAMRGPWSMRSLRELVARTRDISDALIRYQIDRATLGRLPSDRYSQLFVTHNAWRESLLRARGDVRRGELEAMLTGSPGTDAPAESGTVTSRVDSGAESATSEGSADSQRPQSILPDEL
jgi:hypothetical protein